MGGSLGSEDDAGGLIEPAGLRVWTARIGLLVTAIVLFRLGFELWWAGGIHGEIWVQLLVVALYALGLALLGLAVADVDHERLDWFGFLALLASLAVYAAISLTQINLRYTSDALLFVHEAGRLLLDGVNPYAADLVGGYVAFDVPYYVQTPTTSGGIVTNLNYPALSFLFYAPFVSAGAPDLRPISLGILLVLLGVVYLATPRSLRLLVVSSMFLSSFFLSFALSGFDILFVLFLIVSMVLWDRHPRAAFMFFGLAAAVKQTVWFIAPFLLVARWRELSAQPGYARTRETMLGIAIAGIVFLVPNLPFIVWDPGAWAAGILTPFGFNGATLVPLSQGLTIPFYTGAVRVDPLLLNLLAGSVLVSLLGIFWLRYEKLRMLPWLVPPIVLAFAHRSLQNYFEMFYPVALVAIMLTAPRLLEADEPEPDPEEDVPGPARTAPYAWLEEVSG